MPQPRRIIVFLPNWIGDAVMATPALRALRQHFADAHITHLGRPGPLETLRGLDLADEQLADDGRRPVSLGGFWHLTGQIRRGHYELGVLLPNSFGSALVARLGGVDCLAGYARDGRGWMLNVPLRPPRDDCGKFLPISAVDYYLALAEHLGARCDSRRMTLAVPPRDAAAAAALLEEAALTDRRPLVMLNPGASFGVSKVWKPDRYAALADALIERRGAGIILNAAPAERTVAEAVAAAMRHPPQLNLARRDNSIGLVKALAARCDLVVTNDTGARHIAAAVGAAVVTLFGSTDPRWSAIDYELERVIRVDVPCSPCQKRLCYQPPGPAYHQCMEAITVERVLPAAEELLDLQAARRGHRP
ncbi:MAG: lipopolysaccharide heptosyltransferase II [Phycisphaerae bacterium]|nr:lipopolysaccharide heptosyltransferase II [Phycisphaerae bacterium]